jgi:hypothetical protein
VGRIRRLLQYLIAGLTWQSWGVLAAGLLGFVFAVLFSADQASKQAANEGTLTALSSILGTNVATVEKLTSLQTAASQAVTESERQYLEKQATDVERERRHAVVHQLRQLYRIPREGGSTEAATPFASPSADWMNAELQRLGERFTVTKQGDQYAVAE